MRITEPSRCMELQVGACKILGVIEVHKLHCLFKGLVASQVSRCEAALIAGSSCKSYEALTCIICKSAPEALVMNCPKRCISFMFVLSSVQALASLSPFASLRIAG